MNNSNKTMTAEQFKREDFIIKLVVLLVMWGSLIGLLAWSIKNNWSSGPAGPVAIFLGMFFLCLGAGGTGGKNRKKEKDLSGDIFAMLCIQSFGHIVIYIFVGAMFQGGRDAAGISLLITGAAVWFLEIWPARAFLGDEVRYVLGNIGKKSQPRKNNEKNSRKAKREKTKGDAAVTETNDSEKDPKPYVIYYLNREGKVVSAIQAPAKVGIRFFDDTGNQIREFITEYTPEEPVPEPEPKPEPKPQPKPEPQPEPERKPEPEPELRPEPKPEPQPEPVPTRSLSQAEVGNIVARAKSCYQRGNYTEAVKLFRQAAETGHIYSQLMLGQCYEFGMGVPVNYYDAVKWYQKAADQGDSQGQRCLGVCFEFGKGVEKDPKKAVELYRKSSYQGDAVGMCCLAYCYENGIGIEQDQMIATSLYLSAAEKGNARAQFNYANNLKEGRGVPKDQKAAVTWYQKAADQGYASAQNNLAVCYEHGEGVEKDLNKALELFRAAAANGDDKAVKNAENLEKRLKDQAEQERKKTEEQEQAKRRQEEQERLRKAEQERLRKAEQARRQEEEQAARRIPAQDEERQQELRAEAARKGPAVVLWNQAVYGTSGDGKRTEYRVKGVYYPETSKVVIERWNSREGGHKETVDIPGFIKNEQAVKSYLTSNGYTVY